jgi:predicted dehydrogenase/GNAT superfamily N-acetyltransferase
MSSIEIRQAQPNELYDLRMEVLIRGTTRNSPQFPGDEDPRAIHLGAFENGLNVGCASFIPSVYEGEPAWQLRGMATHPTYRGKGIGKQLLAFAEENLPSTSSHLWWCNARTGAVGFYRQQNWVVVSGEYRIEGVGPHYRMVRHLLQTSEDFPSIPYQPKDPQDYNPPIGLIGCGGITVQHLRAYRGAGYQVVALCDLDEARALQRRDEFYPEAKVYTDYRDVLARKDIEVVDVTPHPEERVPIVRESLLAGKHVLSQKPFVLDLDIGAELVALADRQGLKLAVNQNGRWAPHNAYLQEVVRRGLIGEVQSACFTCCWDHNWTAGTRFDQVHHLILYDFMIHWFDLAACVFGHRQARRVMATTTHAPNQASIPPLLGSALVEYENAQALFCFDGNTRCGKLDQAIIAGSQGLIQCSGPDLNEHQVKVFIGEMELTPVLEGHWFPEGFHGTMGELLCAIEEDREPTHSARNNLRGLALCFAAVGSADEGRIMIPGEVRRIRPATGKSSTE